MRARDGIRLHARVTGFSGVPLVLCHGFTLSSYAWDLMAASLPGRRIVAVDLRGHGDSDWDPAARYDRATMTEDLREVLDALEIERCVLVGHSLGGDIAARLTQACPSRVAGLVFVDIGPDVREKGLRFVRGWTAQIPYIYESRDEYREWLEATYPFAGREVLATLVTNDLRAMPDGQLVRKLDPAFRDVLFAEEDTRSPEAHWARLEAFELPVHVIRGSASAILTDATAKRMVCLAKDGSYTVVPSAGHSVMLDNPVGMAAALADFVDGKRLPLATGLHTV